MRGRQIAVDLASVARRIDSTVATQKRLNDYDTEVVFEPEHTVGVAADSVDFNETTVIRIALAEPMKPPDLLSQERIFAADTAGKSQGRSHTFRVGTDALNAIVSTRLVIGLHRRGGVTSPLVVAFYGAPIIVDNGDASEFTEF